MCSLAFDGVPVALPSCRLISPAAQPRGQLSSWRPSEPRLHGARSALLAWVSSRLLWRRRGKEQRGKFHPGGACFRFVGRSGKLQAVAAGIGQPVDAADPAPAGVRVVDTRGPKGKVLMVDHDVNQGDVVFRNYGLWVMKEDVDFSVETSPSGSYDFQFKNGSQTVLDGFCALPCAKRAQVLQLFCPSEPPASLRRRFGDFGERVRQVLEIAPDVSDADVWRAMQIFWVNSQATRLRNGKFIVAVYPLQARMSHSCDPNVDLRVDGDGYLTVSAIRRIDAGEELCESYLSTAELERAWQQRHERLLSGWGFVCECPRCLAERRNS